MVSKSTASASFLCLRSKLLCWRRLVMQKPLLNSSCRWLLPENDLRSAQTKVRSNRLGLSPLRWNYLHKPCFCTTDPFRMPTPRIDALLQWLVVCSPAKVWDAPTTITWSPKLRNLPPVLTSGKNSAKWSLSVRISSSQSGAR